MVVTKWHRLKKKTDIFLTMVIRPAKSNSSPELGSCPQPPQYIYIFPRLPLSKRQWCMMGMQSASPLRTLPLHSGPSFDVCCSKHRQISPIRHLLRDGARHKSANEHIRREPQKEKRYSCKWNRVPRCLCLGRSVCRAASIFGSVSRAPLLAPLVSASFN